MFNLTTNIPYGYDQDGNRLGSFGCRGMSKTKEIFIKRDVKGRVAEELLNEIRQKLKL